MRCSCRECGTYMVHKDRGREACVCPECGNECRVCLGEGIALPPIVKDKEGKIHMPEYLIRRFENPDKK